ncbi:MAG: lipoyl synthase [Candidatus Omnitrophica bacterium]|nr:lipoyl synthase [Candidatus Omnitrophota bacterium]
MACLLEDNTGTVVAPLPKWFRQDIPDMAKIRKMKDSFRQAGLHTVCESALCPNLGQCWGRGVATFMILGEICTRACRFCGVKTGRPAGVDPEEPRQVALAVQQLNLRYVVVTSVARDDLADEGAGQFVQTIHAIRSLMPQTRIEVLIPDFSNQPECLARLTAARPDVISHNMETVRRLSPDVRPQADYERSLAVLRNLKKLASSAFIKSGFMVGLGETDAEVTELMSDLVAAGCDMLTIGQYLAPGRKKRYLRVQRFVSPEKFADYKTIGRELGLKHVMSGPLVRSSYIAEEGYRECFEKTVNGE